VRPGAWRSHKVASTFVLLSTTAILLWCITAPGLAVSSLSTERLLASAVRISILLSWPGERGGSADVQGSGWTRLCEPAPAGVGAPPAYGITVATAAHVLDVDDIAQSFHSKQQPTVKVVVAYRDGQQLMAGRENLFVDRTSDYGEIRLRSAIPRQILPVGDPLSVWPGASLVAVASPGNLSFGVFQGNLILKDPGPVGDVPQDAWLSSITVAPGASGAPVIDESGAVVATVIGFAEWPCGGSLSALSVLVPLPKTPLLHSASQARPSPPKKGGLSQ